MSAPRHTVRDVSLPSLQIAFDDLGADLASIDFVVVDLETTGGSAHDCHITEIGAVRTRGGQITGEMQTLVNPGVAIPPFIAALTGITTAAVADAPGIEAALPTFLEFAHGGVLVAHNAGFDTGFLKVACRRTDTPWPGFQVVDTARLARVLLHADETPNHRLATLARVFRSGTTPNHRALTDARATVDVLHGLFERAADFGVTTLEDLVQLTSRVRPEQRRKRTLADGLPDLPGVYQFIGPDGRTLYVGKSTSIRTRVRSYFTAAETRARVIEMVRIAHHVEPIVCASELEASVREIRLIAERRPPYNRRSRNPDKAAWLKLTAEPFPRLAVVNAVSADSSKGAVYVGPYGSRRAADQAREAVQSVYALRTCTPRLAMSVRTPACIAAELATCLAPCHDDSVHVAYSDLSGRASHALTVDASPVVAGLRTRMAQLAEGEQYEVAARDRDRLAQLLSGLRRSNERSMLAGSPEIVAAGADGRDWEVHVVRFGRLAATTRVSPGMDPIEAVQAVVATAEIVTPDPTGQPSALPEETALILRWLWSPGVRLVRLQGTLAMSTTAPQRYLGLIPARQPGYEAREPARSAATPTHVSRIAATAPESRAARARAR
jgi:DNA polymerase III subunit epsilon